MSDVMDVLRLSGRYSQVKRNRPPDDPIVIEAHRDLVAARLLVHVSEIMASSPPLTSDQVGRIAALLRAVGGPR